MNASARVGAGVVALLLWPILTGSALMAQNTDFHNAPASAKQLKNPYEGDAQAAQTGQPLYHLRCARCHGEHGEGSGNIPAFVHGRITAISSGELFWFVTKGDKPNGMPSWATLPKTQRWQIITYIKALAAGKGTFASAAPAKASAAEVSKAAPPNAPFTDYRFEKPGQVRKITVQDCPAPYASRSAGNGPSVVARPEGAWPQVPSGFQVEQYASGLEGPRLIRTAPNGDFFVAESRGR